MDSQANTYKRVATQSPIQVGLVVMSTEFPYVSSNCLCRVALLQKRLAALSCENSARNDGWSETKKIEKNESETFYGRSLANHVSEFSLLPHPPALHSARVQ